MNPLALAVEHPRSAAVFGALAIAFSGIFYLWSGVSPSTGVFWRCVYGLPILLIVAWHEWRTLGPMSRRAVGLCATAGVPFRIVETGDPGVTYDVSTPRVDLPPYDGPPQPADAHAHEWGAAEADRPDD